MWSRSTPAPVTTSPECSEPAPCARLGRRPVSKLEAREQALSALYAADAVHAEEPDLSGLSARAGRLASGVWQCREELDEIIASTSTGWRVERMPSVDRNVLRIGVYELRETETPVGVVISEAVELAKRYSTAGSGRFVNGVLAAIAEDPEDPEAPV